jgi:hypothetical protein
MDVRAEKIYHDVTVAEVRQEESPVKRVPLLVWHLLTDGGKKLYHRTAFSEAAKPVILAEFQRAGCPLINGLEAGCEEIKGKRVRVCVDERGDVHIVGRSRE